MDLRVTAFEKEFTPANGELGFVLQMPMMSYAFQDVTFIMGHNGSGKSVLMNLMSGDMTPSRGTVKMELEDRDGIQEVHDNKPAGIVRQRAEESLALDLSVRANLLIRLYLSRFISKMTPAKSLNNEVQLILRDYPILQKKIDQPCFKLSVGQRQTLAFLSVASRRAPLLLLDEFLAATDLATSSLLRRLAEDYARNVPAVVLIVSHDIGLALQAADRILILNNGQLTHDIAPGSPEWSEKTLVQLLTYKNM